jgi:hypothetical protein
MISRHLGYVRVLAKKAFQIATDCGYGIGSATRQKMKKRFFFNRVHMLGYDFSINKAYKGSLLVFSYTTYPFCPLLYQALVVTKKTPHPFPAHLFI